MADGSTQQYILGENNQMLDGSAQQYIVDQNNEVPESSTQQYILDENNQMPGGSTQQYILGQKNQISGQYILGAESSVEVFDSTTVVNNEQSSSKFASILATMNVLTDEVQKMRAELGETTKKIDEIYDVFIKGGAIAGMLLNRRNDQTPAEFVFEPIPNVGTALIVEKLLGDTAYEDSLVRKNIYELVLS